MRTSFKLYLLTAAFLSAASMFAAAQAASLTQLTGPSPFSGCNIAGEPGVNYLNAEVEPWVDVNPANPARMIAAWQQDRWSNGGSRSLMGAASFDGGATWSQSVVPHINKCSGATGDGAYDRSSDPWVAISPNGTSYFMSLSFYNDRPDGGGGVNAMLVSKSTDGGLTWGEPTALIRDTDGKAFNDKNSITADPGDSNYVYAVWDRLYDNSLPSTKRHGDGAENARKNHKDNVEDAINRGGTSANFKSYVGPVYFSRTTDGGATWSTRQIYDPGVNSQTIANQVVVLNNHTVIDFYTQIDHNGQTSIGYLKSSDHGATFDAPQTAVKTAVTTSGTVTPDARQAVRDGNILFDVAVDRTNNNLYLVWQDGQSQNIDRVYFSMSTNGGASWSAPVYIAKTPYSTNKLRLQSFIPSVEVGNDHKVYVTYYDFRNDTSDGRELADYWATTCDIAAGANCRTSAGWSTDIRLTNVSFDILNAPVASGHFLGDYEGLVRQGTAGMRAVFGTAVGVNLNDMFTTLIP